LLNFGDEYITGKNPKPIKEMTDYDLFYHNTDKLIQRTEMILGKYQELIVPLKQQVRAADYELIKLGAVIAAVSVALMITVRYKWGKLKH